MLTVENELKRDLRLHGLEKQIKANAHDTFHELVEHSLQGDEKNRVMRFDVGKEQLFVFWFVVKL